MSALTTDVDPRVDCDGISQASDAPTVQPVGDVSSERENKLTVLLTPETRHAFRRRCLEPQASSVPPLPPSPPRQHDAAVAAEPSAAPSASHPDYEILQEIGRGKFSTVYEAYDRTLQRYVAIKKLDQEFHNDDFYCERFWREARFLASLEHPNIIKVFAVEPRQGWIIMELMSGSLRQRLLAGPLAPDLVRSVVRQALEGLAYLHDRGRIHGEIKPANLLIDDAGRIKLSDSPGFTAEAEFRAPAGSLRHVAPELLCPAVFGPVGPAVDLYSLGFAALELLLGAEFDTSFRGVADEEMNQDLGWMRWHSAPTEQLPPLRQLLPRVPNDLLKVIEGLIKKPVAQRYASAADALRDLDELPLLLIDVPQARRLDTGSQCKPSVAVVAAPNLYLQAVQDGKVRQPEPSAIVSYFRRLVRLQVLKIAWRQPAILCSLLVLIALVLVLAFSSPPEPTETVPMCLVTITSDPSEAFITLDGRESRAVTPGQVSLPPGSHRVLVTKEGYLAVERSFAVPPGQPHYRVALITLQRHEDPSRPRAEAGGSGGTRQGASPDPLRNGTPAPGSDLTEDTTQQPAEPKRAEPEQIGRIPLASVPPAAEPVPRMVVGPWPLPNTLSREDVTRYASLLREIVGEPWDAGSVEQGRAAFAAAAAICPEEARLNQALALLLWKHRQHEEAQRQLEAAVAKRRGPYFAPWRQLVWLYVFRDNPDRAATETVKMLLEAARDARQAAGTGESRVADAVLEENAHFAACLLGYLQSRPGFAKIQFFHQEGRLEEALPPETWARFARTKRACVGLLTRVQAECGLGFRTLKTCEANGLLADISRHCFPADLEWQRVEFLMTLPADRELQRQADTPSDRGAAAATLPVRGERIVAGGTP